MPREAMSMQAIRAWLAAHPEERQRVLQHNESYVFFRPLAGPPEGSLGRPLTPGRSVATDARLFPPGALAFLDTEQPERAADGSVRWTPLSRFVLNQDTGGAIRGAGRVDFFWGRGERAAFAAGLMRQPGRLYFLVARPAAATPRASAQRPPDRVGRPAARGLQCAPVLGRRYARSDSSSRDSRGDRDRDGRGVLDGSAVHRRRPDRPAPRCSQRARARAARIRSASARHVVRLLSRSARYDGPRRSALHGTPGGTGGEPLTSGPGSRLRRHPWRSRPLRSGRPTPSDTRHLARGDVSRRRLAGSEQHARVTRDSRPGRKP